MPSSSHHPIASTGDHALLTTLLLLLACELVNAQPAPSGNYDYMAGATQFSPAMAALLVVLITAFFFLGFFSIYIRHCGRGSGGSTNPSLPAAGILALSRLRQQRGLDAEVLESFPTMKYAEAKELRIGKGAALECAVCLSEFDDDEQLRLLPKCSHAFHPDCIGAWLANHVTCPVCRCNLEPDTNAAEESGAAESNSSGEAAAPQADAATAVPDAAPPVQVVVDVDNTEEEERRKEAMELERIGSQRRAIRSRSGRPPARFPRSHSTGHSVAVRLDGDLERFTLRLPEHVRKEMIAAGEESLRRGRRVGEGSSRSVGRSVRFGPSDRWPSFLARTFSTRVPFWAVSRRAEGDGGEGSTTASGKRAAAATGTTATSAKGSVRFDCLGGGASAARVGAVAGEEKEEEKAFARQV